MASDNHAHYSKIGLSVLLGTAAIVAALIWLGGLGDGDDPVFAETYYYKSVSGLSVGSPVNFRGVQVGKVAAIDFVGNRYKVTGEENQRIFILMALNRKTFRAGEDEELSPEEILEKLVKAGMRATVTASGITGLSRIECDMHNDAIPPQFVPKWKPHTPYIPPKVSLLEDFSSAATRVMNQINAMDFTSVWSNVSDTARHVADSARATKAIIETHRDGVSQIVNDISDAATSLRDLSHDLKRNPSSLLRGRRVEPLEETETR